jgi:hypothetical protein
MLNRGGAEARRRGGAERKPKALQTAVRVVDEF